jgi:threonyl-tRNA synthetase
VCYFFLPFQHSSAYWLAKAENASLQRVYGISFPNKEKLKEWKAFMKMAEERDHRRIGQQQELFFFHKWSGNATHAVVPPCACPLEPKQRLRADHPMLFAHIGRCVSMLSFVVVVSFFRSPGSAFFLPHGTRVYNKLMKLIKDEYAARGYQEVITPNVFNIELWKKSGHYDNYKENM